MHIIHTTLAIFISPALRLSFLLLYFFQSKYHSFIGAVIKDRNFNSFTFVLSLSLSRLLVLHLQLISV